MPKNESKIVGYKKIFGFILPDWVDERMVNMTVGYFFVGLVMIFALILFVRPEADTVSGLEAQYKRDATRLTNLNESRDSLNKLLQQVPTTEQDAVFRAMPIDYSPDLAVSTMRKVALSTGVSIVDYSLPQGNVFEEGNQEFTGGGGSNSGKDNSTSIIFGNSIIQVTVQGDVDRILAFVDSLEKSLPLAFVSDLGIQQAVRVSLGNSTKVNLKLQVKYYRPMPKQFNVAELKNFSKTELDLVKELAGYAAQYPIAIYSSPSAQTVGQSDLFGL